MAHPLLNDEHNTREFEIMYNRRFFQTKLGQAALASIAAMAAFVALSAQMQATPAYAAVAQHEVVELA